MIERKELNARMDCSKRKIVSIWIFAKMLQVYTDHILMIFWNLDTALELD